MIPPTALLEKLRVALAGGEPAAIRAAAQALHDALATDTTAAERAEHTDRLLQLGTQAAELVHELRQPLLAVKGYAQLILERPQDQEFVRQTSETVVEQSERMEVVLERVRSYSRGSEPAVRPAGADVNAALRSATELLGYQLRKRAVSVATELTPELPRAAVDPVGLQQILVNLIANARDALTDRAGTIRLRTAAADGMLEVTVEDDGPGIDAAMRDRLFQPFATGKAGGTGLGLAVSREIALRAGGDLELVPSEKGACFRLRLRPLGAAG